MRSFADAIGNDRVSVAVAGSGWPAHGDRLPRHWHYVGPRTGLAYGEFLRSAKIALAPVNREVVIRGVKQPGYEDTTRTYELAAAHCFFLRQRTDYVATVYDEPNEVPLWVMQLSLPVWCGAGCPKGGAAVDGGQGAVASGARLFDSAAGCERATAY